MDSLSTSLVVRVMHSVVVVVVVVCVCVCVCQSEPNETTFDLDTGQRSELV